MNRNFAVVPHIAERYDSGTISIREAVMQEQELLEKTDIKQVGIWIRVSTEDQAKGESPEHHEKRARFYAESKDWRVREVYHLEAVSGKSVMAHPEAQRMLADVKAGHITALLFSKLARLARNTRELLDFADLFRTYGADLVSLHEAIDTSTPPGRFFYTVIAAMAEWEREEIAERVAASIPIRAKLGKPLGGAAPFGYRWENRQLVPDLSEAPIRKLIYELFLEHRRKKTIANLLNDMGHRTRNGGKFTDTTISRLLRDPTAKGMRRANYTRTLGENKKWVLKPEKEWVWLAVEPIISEELWARCNALLEDRKKGRRPGRKPTHLFTGVVYCHCGEKMYVPSSTPKYICYRCRNKIPTGDLEGIFQEQLKNFFLSPVEITHYLEQADKTIKEKRELLETLESDSREVRQSMDKVMKLYLNDQISKEGFGKEYGPLEKRSKQLEDQIPQLQGEIDFLKIQYLSSDDVLHEAQDLYSRWETLEQVEKRKIVENITERITIGKDDVTINLCYLPYSSEIIAENRRSLMDSSPRPA
jgi:site-specific DNA recombinase